MWGVRFENDGTQVLDSELVEGRRDEPGGFFGGGVAEREFVERTQEQNVGPVRCDTIPEPTLVFRAEEVESLRSDDRHHHPALELVFGEVDETAEFGADVAATVLAVDKQGAAFRWHRLAGERMDARADLDCELPEQGRLPAAFGSGDDETVVAVEHPRDDRIVFRLDAREQREDVVVGLERCGLHDRLLPGNVRGPRGLAVARWTAFSPAAMSSSTLYVEAGRSGQLDENTLTVPRPT